MDLCFTTSPANCGHIEVTFGYRELLVIFISSLLPVITLYPYYDILFPSVTVAYLNLGIVYTNLGRKDEAEKVYRHCAEIDISGLKDPRLHEQTKISALYNLGRLLADQERYHESADVYKLAIQRRPQHYAPQSLYNMLGE